MAFGDNHGGLVLMSWSFPGADWSDLEKGGNDLSGMHWNRVKEEDKTAASCGTGMETNYEKKLTA